MSDSHSVLVLGTHSSGKTTFAAQLLGRIQRVPESRLRERAAPGSLTPYRAALESIEQGRAPEHTEMSLFAETPLPLVHGEAGAVDLVWPEYAGETVHRMVVLRRVPQKWHSRLRASDVWLLFVRLSNAFVPEDVISRRISPAPALPSGAEDDPARISDLTRQTELIELLQILLHLRGVSTTAPVQRPVLGVLLSCFDEVQPRGQSLPPMEVFSGKLPLLAAFVESIWAPASRVILGLSSSGRPLLRDEPDEDFMLQGPERQGYVVLPEGQEDSDLTLAVALPLECLLHG